MLKEKWNDIKWFKHKILDSEYTVTKTGREVFMEGWWEGSGRAAWAWIIVLNIICLITKTRLGFVKR